MGRIHARIARMRESAIENYLVRKVKEHGGVAEKFKSPQKKNVPDRVCSWPLQKVDFVELKATGESPTDAQSRDHKRRLILGHYVWVLDCKEDVDGYLRYCVRRHARLTGLNPCAVSLT